MKVHQYCCTTVTIVKPSEVLSVLKEGDTLPGDMISGSNEEILHYLVKNQ